MTERLCPITGEPLPVTDPGRIVSQTACNRLHVATSNLADIMAVLDQMIAGAGRIGEGGKPVLGSKPPLNLGLWTFVDELRDTIDIWANNLIAEARPGLYYQPGNWVMAQAIFQQYSDLCGHWTHGDVLPGILCIERVIDAVGRLEKIAFPPEQAELSEIERQDARKRLETMELTIGPACEAIRLITGDVLPRQTVYSWERRGKITAKGTPKRYLVSELLCLKCSRSVQD